MVMNKSPDDQVAETRQTDKKQEVLDVASEYFLGHGYQGTSINAMARSSGISKESIYRYFRSKKKLFEAVIDKELVDYQSQLEHLNLEFSQLDLGEALVKFASVLQRVVSTDRNLALRRLIFHEAIRSADIGQHYYQIAPMHAYRNLEKLFALHRDKSDFDPKTLSHHFVAMVLHKLILERECRVRKRPTKAQIGELATAVVDDFLKAFFKS